MNANKRGITLDLDHPNGIEIAKRLVAWADVVVENFTPRVVEGFGLDWDTVHALNSRAVMLRMPAFGLTGPWRDHVGFAQTMEQVSGLAWVTGYPDDQPVIPRGPCDPLGGMHGAFAIQVALAERDATGDGVLVEMPLVESALQLAAEQVIEHTAYGHLLERAGNRSPGVAPQGVYACEGDEQWLALSIATDVQWRALVDALGSPSWATDPALDTFEGRRTEHDRIDVALDEWAATCDLDATVQALVERGVPAAAVTDPRQVHECPQLVGRGFYEEIDHAVVGRHLVSTWPFHWRGIDRWLRSPAPTLGEHNAEVLAMLGLGDDEIETLAADGVIGTRMPT